MVNLSDIQQESDTVIDITKSMVKTIEQLQEENTVLQKRVRELEQLQDLGSEQAKTQEQSFGIAVDNGPVKTEQKHTPVSIPSDGEIPALGPDSVDETDLDELLATDALVATVYNRLRPLKELKYRLLAMQMGISIDRCKIAIEKLERAGAVKINENEIVSIIP